MGTTPIYGFPYPDPSDLVANYPALGQQLAEDIEDVLPTIGGLAPVAPTTIANSGGSASITANTTTFSAVNSVSLNGVFSSTYRNYRIIVEGISSADSVDIVMRLRTSGTDNSSASYNRQYIDVTSATVAAGRSTGLTTAMLGVFDDDDSANLAVFDIMKPNLADRTSYFSNSFATISGAYLRIVGGYFDNTTVFDGITFFASAGTITGTVAVYGYKK